MIDSFVISLPHFFLIDRGANFTWPDARAFAGNRSVKWDVVGTIENV